MQRLGIAWVVLVMLCGCASRETIMRNYEEQVAYEDGVDAREAKLIAKRKIIAVPEKRNYKITAPSIIDNEYTRTFPEHWFVVFGRNWLSPISTDMTAKTYTELKKAQYLVVIEQKTGKIIFAGEYYPERAQDFQWVFQERRPWEERVTPPAGVPSL